MFFLRTFNEGLTQNVSTAIWLINTSSTTQSTINGEKKRKFSLNMLELVSNDCQNIR